jgi:predicted transcriptional regulator
MKEVMTIRLDSETKNKLEQLAKATARSKSFLATEAIRDYIEVNEWQIQAIREGLRQADEGELIPHADIRTKWEKKVAGYYTQG